MLSSTWEFESVSNQESKQYLLIYKSKTKVRKTVWKIKKNNLLPDSLESSEGWVSIKSKTNMRFIFN